MAAKRVKSPKAAIAGVRAALRAQVGAPALAAFRATPEASSAAAATTLLAEGTSAPP